MVKTWLPTLDSVNLFAMVFLIPVLGMSMNSSPSTKQSVHIHICTQITVHIYLVLSCISWATHSFIKNLFSFLFFLNINSNGNSFSYKCFYLRDVQVLAKSVLCIFKLLPGQKSNIFLFHTINLSKFNYLPWYISDRDYPTSSYFIHMFRLQLCKVSSVLVHRNCVHKTFGKIERLTDWILYPIQIP